MTTLGVTCDNRCVYLAVVDEGVVQSGYPERVENPSGLEREDRLAAVYDDVARVIDEISPDRIVILRPEATYKATHSQFTPRIGLETLVRLAASRKEIPLDTMSRPSLRSALNLSRRGRLEAHLSTVFDAAVGGYWNGGRGLAAMVALGAEKN